MAVVAALATGAFVGARHALETDHLAAIGTLVDGEATDSPALVGASWGVGHAIPIVAVGLLALALGVELPPSVAVGVEALVGVVLVALGLRMLAGVVGWRSHRHAADADTSSPSRATGTTGVHRHLTLGGVALGRAHSHVDGEGFAVGVLHGVAGSGALVVLLVAGAETVPAAVSFLVGFAALSTVTMAGVSACWGWTLETGAARYLEAGAALLGIAVGALVLVEQLPHLL